MKIKQTLKTPRWIALGISLGMVAFGWYAGHGFEYLSHRFPRSGPPNMFDGRFDPETVICIFLFYIGIFLSVISIAWVLIVESILLLRRIRSKHPKQV